MVLQTNSNILGTIDRIETDRCSNMGAIETRLCCHQVYAAIYLWTKSWEQVIKDLKQYGTLPGITQDEESFNRFIKISPHLARFVENFLRNRIALVLKRHITSYRAISAFAVH